MGTFTRAAFKTGIIAAIAFALFSCGNGREKVETVRGPKGDKGDAGQNGQSGQPGAKGDKGDAGQVVVQTPQPQPTYQPQPQPGGQPPVIIYPPYPSDPGNYCSGCIIVCACVEHKWQSIIINVHDRYRYNIKNDGVCY